LLFIEKIRAAFDKEGIAICPLKELVQ